MSLFGYKVRVGGLWKLRREDPHPAQPWTGGLLEGHFSPTEEEGWAGLTILACGHDGNLGGWLGALEGREGERPHLLHEFACGSPVAKQECSLDSSCFLPT